MGIFSGLSKFGLGGLSDKKIIEDKPPEKAVREPVPEKTPEEVEKDSVFEKKMKCPVCDLMFPMLKFRPGKVKLMGSDTDLRPKYEKADPLKYDAIVCTNCGYAGLSRYFEKVTGKQIKEIKEQIYSNFKGIHHPEDMYTYDDAIARYELALASSVVKNAKNSERAYTALKYAWVIRGKRESIGADKSRVDEIKELYLAELDGLQVAYEGFTLALAKETTPICGMDGDTVMYILADLARRLKKYDEAARLVGTLIVRQGLNPRLKDKVVDLKAMIVEEKKKLNAKEEG